MEVDKPPFSIVRNGWGEFDIKISIFFQDIHEEPIVKIHNIQIFHNNQNQRATIKKPVVNETYDEIVFVEPTELFNSMLVESNGQTEPVVDSGEFDVKEEGKDEEMENEDDPYNDNEADKDLAPEIGKNFYKITLVDDVPEVTESNIKEEAKIKEEGALPKEEIGAGDDVIEKSTYEVRFGADNEQVVDVRQFFIPDHGDKSDVKMLTEALKSLKDETEYLRNEVRNSEKEITEKKEKLASLYDKS